MPPIVLAPTDPAELFVARLLPADDSGGPGAYVQPRHVQRSGPDLVHGLYKDGKTRSGKPADVKPGVHWMLTATEDGSLSLKPVNGWYEFSKPMPARDSEPSSAPGKAGSSGNKTKRTTESGEAELLKEAGLRKNIADRWDAMLERRAGRVGVRVARGQILNATVHPVSNKVVYPEDDRLKDDTGLKKHLEKKKKQMKKEARALEGIEDDDVPETANALLMLKSQRGEGGWDFEDDGEFSDEEQEDFDEQLQRPQAEDPAPSADEDDAEEPEKDLLSRHGREIEVLLQQYGQGGTPDQAEAEEGAESGEEGGGGAAPSAHSGSEASDGESKPKRPRGRPPKKKPREQSSDERDGSGTAAPSGAASGSAEAPVSASSRTPAAPAPQPGKAPTQQAASEGASSAMPTEAQLRQHAIECLRRQGGRCTLQTAAEALGLKDSRSPLYSQVVAILKEVASVERVPGESRAMLVLKLTYR